MEQQSALLSCWLHGSPIADLSALLEQAPDQIESHLRAELHKIRNEVVAAPALARPIAPPPAVETAVRRKAYAPAPATRKAIHAAAPGTPKTSPKSLVKSAVREGDPALAGYPPQMRRADQGTARKAFEMLKSGPKKLDDIAEALGVSYDAVWLACRNMLKAGLVQRTEEQPYRWTLVQRSADAAAGD